MGRKKTENFQEQISEATLKFLLFVIMSIRNFQRLFPILAFPLCNTDQNWSGEID